MLDLMKKPVFKFGVPVLSAVASALHLGVIHPVTIGVVVGGVLVQFVLK
jgi:hypothetical protein